MRRQYNSADDASPLISVHMSSKDHVHTVLVEQVLQVLLQEHCSADTMCIPSRQMCMRMWYVCAAACLLQGMRGTECA
jgi:hypothetical protein